MSLRLVAPRLLLMIGLLLFAIAAAFAVPELRFQKERADLWLAEATPSATFRLPVPAPDEALRSVPAAATDKADAGPLDRPAVAPSDFEAIAPVLLAQEPLTAIELQPAPPPAPPKVPVIRAFEWQTIRLSAPAFTPASEEIVIAAADETPSPAVPARKPPATPAPPSAMQLDSASRDAARQLAATAPPLKPPAPTAPVRQDRPKQNVEKPAPAATPKRAALSSLEFHQSGRQLRVAVDRANLRAVPGTDGRVLFTLGRNAVVTIIWQDRNGWVFVEAAGRRGYVKGHLLGQ